MKQLIRSGISYWQCEECRFIYQQQEFARQCEAWCREHGACNEEIIQHAVFGERDWNDPEQLEEPDDE